MGGSPGQPEFVQPLIASASIVAGQLVVRFEARAAQPYRLLASTDTLNGPWEVAAAAPPEPAARTIELIDPVQPGASVRFYRLVSP